MSYEHLYTPQTALREAGERALAIRQQQHTAAIDQWEREKERMGADLRAFGQRVEEDKQASRKDKADNWLEQDALKSDKTAINDELALVRRDQAALERGEQEHRAREDERRRNRTYSMAFIEDCFSRQSPSDVVKCLSNSSLRIRKHSMDNISFCINGPIEVPPSFVRFGAADIATLLLPKLHDIISVTMGPTTPIDSVRQFSEEIVSSPPMAKALALNGQCPLLTKYLVHPNELVSLLAISSLSQMIRLESAIVKKAYEALNTAVGHIPVPKSASDPFHPSVKFFAEVSPKIVGDCFKNNLFSAVAPLVTHKIDVIRRVVLPKIVYEAQSSDGTRDGLVKARTLRLLQHCYEAPQPPTDTIEFFGGLLPLLAHKMCRHPSDVNWLVGQLANPNTRINAIVVEALRTSSRKEDPAVYEAFILSKVLQRLDKPPTQASLEITRLICDLLPVLAIPHARTKTCLCIIHFLDHTEGNVAKACLIACKKIVDSTFEHRAELFSDLTKLDLTRESTLELLAYLIPPLCKDWAASGDLAKISRFLPHPDQRVRVGVHQVWRDILFNTPDARAQISLDEVFQLCDSEYEDCVVLGSQLLPAMAIEIAKAGANSTRRLVQLLNHPRLELRQAVLQSIQIISNSGDTSHEVLRAADAFNMLILNLQEHPLDGVENAESILVSLAADLSDSRGVCCGLIQLLNSKVPQVENLTRVVLLTISTRNIEYRETLRNTILESLGLASDAVMEYIAKAIKDWIGPDLVQLNDFKKLFQLLSHSNRRIQNGALHTLSQSMKNEKYHDALERAGVVSVIQSLSDSNNAEAIGFVSLALRSMALAIARGGHVGGILRLLTNEVPKIRESAAAAIQVIANGREDDRKRLLDDDILERLTGGDEGRNQAVLELSSKIMTKLAFDYVHAGKVHLVLSLVDHRQESIRLAAIKSVTAITGGSGKERKVLRDALLPLLGGAPATLLDVAAGCLRQTLAHDLVSDGDYKQIFDLLENEDSRIRAPLISELQHHIRGSSEAVRKALVDAGILNAILHASTDVKNDLVLFMVDCMLPVLGPSFTQNDGGAAVIPLLRHEEPRIRVAAAVAIRNGVESRHGSLQKIANARIISNLHSAMEDDSIRDLWCYVLPKVAPVLSHQDEIDLVFNSLSGRFDIVRRVALEAISIMAKTSDETRHHLFPSLLARLDGPPPALLRPIAEAVSLSGFTFSFNNKETELLKLIRNGEPLLVEAAADAIIHLLSDGRPSEHQKLIKADLFLFALDFHQTGSQRRLSLKLLHGIVQDLSYAIILNEELTKSLLYLFDDPDTTLSRILYESLVRHAGDPNSTVPQVISILLDTDRQRKPFVSRLLCKLAPQMVSWLLVLQKADGIVKLLGAEDTSIATAYLRETCARLKHATDLEKDLLADEPQFVITLEEFLKTRDITLRRTSSEIIELLSEGSPLRAVRLIEEGIGTPLAWISMAGGSDAQASLNALWAICSTATDHADQLFKECLPALSEILKNSHRSVDFYMSALRFLKDIVQRTSNSMIVGSGIVKCLITWLSPQHGILDDQCRLYVFQICQLLAQNSESGSQALIDEKVLPVLVQLAADTTANNVIRACDLLKVLAHTGKFRAALMSAGVKDAMERITSTFSKSTLSNRSDKQQAQNAAKGVLSLLNSTKSSRNVLRR